MESGRPVRLRTGTAKIILRHLLAALLLLAGLFAAPTAAHAETYNTCAGFITTLPATINTQGVWCLKQDLTTAITSGNAITIATNNVTIDCNDFKVGGLAAGNSSQTNGIYANTRQNATVRHCNLRGFYEGIALNGGAGHLVEDNRLDNNLYIGIYVYGDNNRVRRNAVYDTGGYPGNSLSFAIYAAADVIDNTVAGVFAAYADTYPYGIFANGAGNEVRGNRVRGLAVAGSGLAIGVYVGNTSITNDSNRISAPLGTYGYGIFGYGVTDTFCSDNTIARFSVAISNCQDAGGNASN